MKLLPIAATVALLAAGPAFAAAPAFLVDFEKSWDYLNGDVNNYYNGGTAADGVSGSNLGVAFVNVSGLSNGDGLGSLAGGNYYLNAPSPQGVAYAHDTAYMNVAGGVDSVLYLAYATPSAISGAVKAYSGLNGSGTLLGSFDFAATSAAGYDSWTAASFNFAGTAQSFDFSAASAAALDNISSVPEPTGLLLAAVGLAGVGLRRRRA